MRYRKITSLSNPHIKEAIKVRERKIARLHDVIIEGPHLIERALASHTEIRKVFFTHRWQSKSAGLFNQLSRTSTELIETSDPVLAHLSDTETPQGIAAIASLKFHELGKLSLPVNPLMVICDGIQDPGNLGTIIRTADAAGANAVIILPETCDPLLPKVVRATAGSVFTIPLVFTESGVLLRWLREKTVTLFVADVNAPGSIYEADLRKPLAFALGNEARGVNEPLRRAGEVFVKIPLLGRAESLNVASSAAICLYEAVRQRGVCSSPPQRFRKY
ncbi:MAG TPA: RNA methyltransferase [Thermodesulfovibrionales bacterium]|nr:RNA methyltransferase [Thermodesulfovibrionales bacterium]